MPQKKKKIGIALSGGGAKGSHTVGCLNYIRSTLNPNIQAVSGTSTGSLIATLVATNQWARLNSIYTKVENENIINPTHSLFGLDLGIDVSFLLSAVLGSESVFQTKGLRDTIEKNLSDFTKVKDSKMRVMYTAVELQSGKTRVFNNRDDDVETLKKGMLASANQPALMDPVTIQGKQYVDGGVKEYLPLSALYKEAEDLDYIIAIASSPFVSKEEDHTFTKSTEILARAVSLFGDEIGRNDYLLSRTINIARKVFSYMKTEDLEAELSPDEISWIKGKRYIPTLFITPEDYLPLESLDFNPEKMKKALLQGEKDAKKAIDSFNQKHPGLLGI